MQATDGDLHDTVHYSLVLPPSAQLQTVPSNGSATPTPTPASNLLRLIEIDPLTGQLSLRASRALGNGPLNVSSCQFHVQASDSLGPPTARHTQQARVSLHVAPQIIGRSINLDQVGGRAADTGTVSVAQSSAPTKQLAARNKQLQGSARARNGLDAPQWADHQATESSNILQVLHSEQQQQASSQRSSLATVMSSFQHMMRSLNFLEMPMSSALLLSALLAFLLCLLLIVIISMSVHVYSRRSKMSARRRHLSAAAQLRHHLTGAAVPQASRQYLAHQRQLPNSKQSLVGNLTIMHQTSSNSSTSTSASTSSAASASSSCTRTEQDAHDGARGQPGGPAAAKTTVPVASASMLEAANDQRTSSLVLSSLTPSSVAADEGRVSKSSQRSGLEAASKSPSAAPTLSSRSDSACSSAVNCGHYSVTNTMETTRTSRPRSGPKGGREEQVRAEAAAARSSLEAAIRSLVKQDREEGSEKEQRPRTSGAQQQLHSSSKQRQKATRLAGELAGASAERPGVKSYRRLPLMSSLSRQNARVAPAEQRQQQQRPADTFASADEQAHDNRKWAASGALQALVRGMDAQQRQHDAHSAIKWPSGAFAQRVKKLTWDDELSVNSEQQHQSDCFIASDIQLSGPISPLSNEHNYQQPPENYLFSASTFATGRLSSSSATQQQQQLSNGSINICTSPQPFHLLDGQQQPSSFLSNQNNCLDYTIVQNCSQFHVDSLSLTTASTAAAPKAPSQQAPNQPSGYSACLPPVAGQYGYSAATMLSPPIPANGQPRRQQVDCLRGANQRHCSATNGSHSPQSSSTPDDLTRALLMSQRPSAVL